MVFKPSEKINLEILKFVVSLYMEKKKKKINPEFKKIYYRLLKEVLLERKNERKDRY